MQAKIDGDRSDSGLETGKEGFEEFGAIVKKDGDIVPFLIPRLLKALANLLIRSLACR